MLKLIVLLTTVALATAIPTNLQNETIADPFFDAYRDVRLLLQTRANQFEPYQLQFRNLDNLLASPFNRLRPTRILVHGWFDDDTTDFSVETSAELLSLYDFNVILVDYSRPRTFNWATAVSRVEPVAMLVASHLSWMRDLNYINYDRLHVIGFSLGAHIAGFIGKNSNRLIHTIVGLDPANLLFNERNPDGRIDANDAQYVECLHSNSGLIGAGIGGHICQADFFPNGGESQPGCLTNTCSHLRAVHYYVESLYDNRFQATRCESERQANRENCNQGNLFWFGGKNSNGDIGGIRGIFHFSTNRNPPFARGSVRPW